jgi:signal peptide peptidase SppA
MKYAHIMAALIGEAWAIEACKLQAILDFMADQAAGVKYSAEEIEARITKSREQEVARQDGSVALLSLRGVIANRMGMLDDISGGTSSEGFGRQFQAAMRDTAVKAIVMDVDSPGGPVFGATEISSMIHAARGTKPIIAHVNARAASKAYWIASAADEIVVTASGEVGSIGVLGVHDDVSGALEKLGVRKTIISAGKFKADGNPYGPLGDESQARIQAKVDAEYEKFIRDVARNRNVSISTVRDGFGQGDMVSAEQAVSEGMADRIGSLEETLQRFGASQFQPTKSGRKAFASEREKRALAI